MRPVEVFLRGRGRENAAEKELNSYRSNSSRFGSVSDRAVAELAEARRAAKVGEILSNKPAPKLPRAPTPNRPLLYFQVLCNFPTPEGILYIYHLRRLLKVSEIGAQKVYSIDRVPTVSRPSDRPSTKIDRPSEGG